jgi:hypothetical protein
LFTLGRHKEEHSRIEGVALSYLASTIFVALFLAGPTYFGWSDPSNKVSLALMTCFLLGSVAGYKARA